MISICICLPYLQIIWRSRLSALVSADLYNFYSNSRPGDCMPKWGATSGDSSSWTVRSGPGGGSPWTESSSRSSPPTAWVLWPRQRTTCSQNGINCWWKRLLTARLKSQISRMIWLAGRLRRRWEFSTGLGWQFKRLWPILGHFFMTVYRQFIRIAIQWGILQ